MLSFTFLDAAGRPWTVTDRLQPDRFVPGAAAPLAALALSGLPADRFLFAGFPPPRQAARRTLLAELAAVPATLILFESPRRLAESLADMADVLGKRIVSTRLHHNITIR